MAIDTASKRFSAAHMASPWRGIAYFPTGTVDVLERQAIAYLYSGIEAENAEPPVAASGDFYPVIARHRGRR